MFIKCNNCNSKREITTDFLDGICNHRGVTPATIRGSHLLAALPYLVCEACHTRNATIWVDEFSPLATGQEVDKPCMRCKQPIPLPELMVYAGTACLCQSCVRKSLQEQEAVR